MPLSPSTMMSRASSKVGPTSAMRRAPCLTRALTNSAPVRVLPKPRPASNSQTRQSPSGGRCDRRPPFAYHSEMASATASLSLRLRTARSLCALVSDSFQSQDKSLTRTRCFLFCRLVLCRFGIALRQHAEMACQRVEHRFFVVQLDAVDLAALGRRDDLGDGHHVGFVETVGR